MFSAVDHSDEAACGGLSLLDTKLLITCWAVAVS